MWQWRIFCWCEQVCVLLSSNIWLQLWKWKGGGGWGGSPCLIKPLWHIWNTHKKNVCTLQIFDPKGTYLCSACQKVISNMPCSFFLPSNMDPLLIIAWCFSITKENHIDNGNITIVNIPVPCHVKLLGAMKCRNCTVFAEDQWHFPILYCNKILESVIWMALYSHKYQNIIKSTYLYISIVHNICSCEVALYLDTESNVHVWMALHSHK